MKKEQQAEWLKTKTRNSEAQEQFLKTKVRSEKDAGKNQKK